MIRQEKKRRPNLDIEKKQEKMRSWIIEEDRKSTFGTKEDSRILPGRQKEKEIIC